MMTVQEWLDAWDAGESVPSLNETTEHASVAHMVRYLTDNAIEDYEAHETAIEAELDTRGLNPEDRAWVLAIATAIYFRGPDVVSTDERAIWVTK